MAHADDALRQALAVALLVEDETQRELSELVKGYLARAGSLDWVRGDGEAPSWTKMATEQGWVGLTVPEEHGGLGLGFAALATVIRECGRRLAYPELLTTAVLGLELLRFAEPAERDRILPLVAAGRCRVAVVGGYEPHFEPLELDSGRLRGAVAAVVDAGAADLLLVPARGPDGTGLYAIESADIERSPRDSLDLSRPHAAVHFDRTAGEPVVPPARFAAAWRRARLRATVALAAEQLGGAEQAFELTRAYITTREQFGRPIGSFQAVKHRCADLFVELQAARSAVEFAIWAADRDHECLPLAAALAKAAASDAFAWVAAETVQLHGGIGFTWEHDAHLYFRRARADETLLGNAAQQRAGIAELLAR